jgi:hypothetical protein
MMFNSMNAPIRWRQEATLAISANQGVFTTTHPAKTPEGAEMRRKLSDPVVREQRRAETYERDLLILPGSQPPPSYLTRRGSNRRSPVLLPRLEPSPPFLSLR